MSVALIVLAGGRGSRLGGLVKPLLVRPDGSTLIEHLIATLAPIADETHVVAPRALAPLFAGGIVEDPGRGPGLALAAAAHATECARMLVVAGDLVAPSLALAELLLEQERSAVVSLGGVWQPTFASVETAGVRALDPGPESLRGILLQLSPCVIDERALDVDMLAAFDDVDTDADLERHGLSIEGVPTWSHLAPDQG